MSMKNQMTSRERVVKAINHQPVDRVPVDLGGTAFTGAHVSVVAQLRRLLGLKEGPVKVSEMYQMLGEVAPDLQAATGTDVTVLFGPKNMFGFSNADWKPWRTFDGTDVLVPGKFNTTPEPNGDILMYPQGDHSVPPSGRMPKGGFYFDAIIRQEPIDESKLNPQDNLEEFHPLGEGTLRYYEKEADALYRNTDLAIATGGPGTALGDIAMVPAVGMKHTRGIRDIEEWYISTAARRGYLMEVFSRQSDIAVENLKRLYQAVGNKIQIIWMDGADLATQTSLFCSPDTYRELYKPFHKKMNDWVHANTAWKTMKHCCGACEPLIGEFAEASFDILNPVQCSATGMDPDLLVEKYGKRIVFWGGGVDTQKVLPFGTAEEVKQQVKERVKIFSKYHGFVFAAIHNIQCKTPAENVAAMLEAAGHLSKK